MVQIVDKVLAKLKDSSWSFEAQLPVRQVGVDPSNRDGCGVSAENVHALGDDIAFMGWSWAELKQPTCIEEGPGETSIAKFNQDFSNGSPLLPTVLEGEIRYGSLSCSHTHMFLRCVEAGVASESKALSLRGKLSLDVLDLKDKEFARAVRRGLTWTVLSHRARSRFPSLLTLVQSARNAAQHVARSEHEVQVMLRIHKLARVRQLQGSEPDWDAVKVAVLRSRPPCAEDLPSLIAFVASCAGGIEAPFLKDLVDFHRLCVNPEKQAVTGLFFKAVANELASAPYTAIAVVKTQYSCPKEKINRHKECVFLAPAELKSKALEPVEDILREVHTKVWAVASAQSIQLPVIVEVLTTLDSKAVRHVLKKDRGSNAAKSLGEVVVAALKLLFARAPSMESHLKFLMDKHAGAEVAGGQAPPLSGPSRDPRSSGGELRLVESQQGVVEAIVKLRFHGFDLDMTVVESKKAPADMFKIKGTTHDQVILAKLQTPSGTSPSSQSDLERTVPVKEFVSTYVLASGDMVQRHPGWPTKSPLQTDAYQLHTAKAMVNIALARVSQTAVSVDDLVEVCHKPARGVRATTEIAAKALKLVLDCFKVLALRADEAVPLGAVKVAITTGSPLSDALQQAITFYVSPTFSDLFVSPAGAIGYTSVAADANMVWDTCTVATVTVVSMPSSASAKSKAPPKGTEFTVEVPVLLNSVKLEASAELLVFRGATKRKVAPILMTTLVAKRTRVG